MISRQAPGRKDVVVIRSMNGEKSKVQARHLTTSINEVYAMFKEANPNIKIGRSKFADLREKNMYFLVVSYHAMYVSANTTRTLLWL